MEITLKNYRPPVKTVVTLEKDLLHIVQEGTLTSETPEALDLSKVLEELQEGFEADIVVDQTLFLLGEKVRFVGTRVGSEPKGTIKRLTVNPNIGLIQKQTWVNLSLVNNLVVAHDLSNVTIGGTLGRLVDCEIVMCHINAFYPTPFGRK